MYTRMIILLIINLYTVRVVINVLGLEDYGIYNVVAGIVTMLSCISTVLASTTQRFYSFTQGENNFTRLKEVYSASIILFVIISLIILLIGETIGLWFTSEKLVIPLNRHNAALVVYHFSLFSFVLNLLVIPYSAAIISHEDMGVYSIITLSDYLLKLVFVLIISYIPFDKLILYGSSLLIAQSILFITYISYSKTHYAECHFNKHISFPVFREIINFSGWTFWSALAGVGMNQVITILVNIYFGPIINAARAVSIQVNNALNSFSNSFIMAVRPQMIKSYAEGDDNYLNLLFSLSNKFIYYFLFMICLPIIINMKYILDLWLNISDQNTILFSQLMVVYTIILALNNPISIIVQATGNIRDYNIYVEIFTILCPVVSFILFRNGFPAYSAYLTMIVCIICSHIVRVIQLKKVYSGFNLQEYLYDFLFKAVLITLLSICIVYLTYTCFQSPLIQLSISLLSSICIVMAFAYFIALNKEEKGIIIGLIKKKSHV